MAERKLLILLAAAALGASLLTMQHVGAVEAHADGCKGWDFINGDCVPEDGTLHVSDEKTVPGRGEDNGEQDGSRGGSGDGGSDSGGSDDSHDLDINCELLDMCGDSRDPITISDLASFSPEHVDVSMEPNGWMIIGLPANFYADADINTETGELFDTAVTVRFTPTSFHWSWGDGTSTSTSTAGASWDELDVKEFTATDTSHTFTEKGTYTISLSVDYSVELRAGNGEWFPVTGTLTADAETITAIATTADSVIVDEECTKNPSGPGC
ncbi:hypothetical protein ACSAGD_11935 [Paramicrobacterium sp. CJ85]|uniref:hypothetical protein n=1 Tax=Paramicrobacterium sp. CJ85 TaxID=3445355 RepID=UPI003F5F9300